MKYRLLIFGTLAFGLTLVGCGAKRLAERAEAVEHIAVQQSDTVQRLSLATLAVVRGDSLEARDVAIALYDSGAVAPRVVMHIGRLWRGRHERSADTVLVYQQSHGDSHTEVAYAESHDRQPVVATPMWVYWTLGLIVAVVAYRAVRFLSAP